MKVQLIHSPENPEQLVACAAKLCYSSASIDSLFDRLADETVQDFISMLSKIGHESPMEHVTFTFAIEQVSRSLLAQITRHRIASFSVQSQRYVMENEFSFVMPPEIEQTDLAKQVFLQAMKEDMIHYNQLVNILKEKHKQQLMQNKGYDEKQANHQAEKKAIEDARFILPNACGTKMIVTMNARSLMNFFQLRCCNRAQWEIRKLAWKMFELVYEKAPNLFANAGPSCLSGICREGKMSCGKSQEVKEYAQQIFRKVNKH